MFRVSTSPARWALRCPENGIITCTDITSGDFLLNWQVNLLDDSIEWITIGLDPDGVIDSITATPSGTLSEVGGASSVTMNWDATDQRWEPAAEFILQGNTVYRFEVEIDVDLKLGGGSCTYELGTSFPYIDLGNVPTANPTVSGVRQVGQTITGADGYFHPDGIPQDTGATVRRWYSYTNAGGTLGETLIGTGSTYTLTSAEAEKYIRFEVTPAATSGPSPGATVKSPVFGIIAPNTVAYTLQNNRNGVLSITNNMNTAGAVAVDWGDGSPLEIFAASTGGATYTKTFTAGTRTFTLYAVPSKINTVSASSQNILAADFTTCTSMTSIVLNFNTGLASLTLPVGNTATWSSLAIINSAIAGVLNLSTIGSMPTTVNVNGSTNLTGIIGNTVGKCTQLQAFGCKLTGVLDLTGVDVGGNIQLNTNSLLTGIIIDKCTTTITNFFAFACGLTGTLDLSDLLLGGNVDVGQNAGLTGLTLPTTSTKINYLRVNNTGIANLNVSGLTGLVQLRFNNCASISTVTMPSSMVQSMTELRGDMSSIGYFDTSTVTFATTVVINLKDCAMTQAEVNCILVDLAAALPTSGTGSVDISGTNAAPDGSTGGCDGTTSVSTINSKGYTILTS